MGKLILKVRGEKLPNMDIFSKSDPYLYVYIAKGTRQTFHMYNILEKQRLCKNKLMKNKKKCLIVTLRIAKIIILLTEPR